MSEGNFKDSNHALQTGMFVGLMIKLGMVAYPVIDDDRDYTPQVIVEDPATGAHFHLVMQPPDFEPLNPLEPNDPLDPLDIIRGQGLT